MADCQDRVSTEPLTALCEFSQPLEEPEFWCAWPEYSALFLERPQDAKEKLLKLAAASDQRLLPFMFSLPINDRTPELEDALWTSGYPMELLNIVADGENAWYKELARLSSQKGSTTEWSASAWMLAMSLSCVASFSLHMRNQAMVDSESSALWSYKLTKLWKTLWDHRSIVFAPGSPRPLGEVFLVVGELLNAYICVYHGAHNSIPPIKSHAAHIAFYLWQRLDEPKENKYCALSISVSIIRHDSPAQGASLDYFKTIITAIIKPESVTDFLCRILTADRPVSATALGDVLTMVTFFVSRGPERRFSPENRKRLLLALAAAYQRYDCVGLPDSNLVKPHEMAEHVLHILMFIWWQEGLENTTEALWAIVEDPFRLNFIRVVAHVIVHVYTHNTGMNADTIQLLLQLWIALAESALEHPTSEELAHKYVYMRRVLQGHWLPVMQDLRSAARQQPRHSMPRPRNGQSADDTEELHSAFREGCQQIYSLWEELGTAYKISGISRRDIKLLPCHVHAEEKAKGCFDTGCPCYGEKPLHKLRRVCKGCWSAYYCGPRCQKRDWEAGHKDSCRRRPSSLSISD